MFAVTPTRTVAFAVSAALNLGLIALVMRSAADDPPVWDETVVMAELVQVRGGANNAPLPTSAQAPSSPPREPAPTSSAAQPTPPQPREAPAASSAAAAAAPAPSPAPAQVAAALGPPAPAAVAQRQGTRDGLDIDAKNGSSTDYASRLRAWLEAHKTYPKRARMRREEGVVHVHFAVDRQGRLLGGDVTRSSGYASLDAEAMAMLDRSNPFPGAPHTVRGERIEVSTPVEFFITR
ncbi:MAG: energy transducer TonB [Phenylobacterium sp.]|uniref:energy transducer TonB n=1 Tax=Phenylobacterium sp. TaxID=1871053 RepID=UPI0025EDFEED|nr:TonB family protein [Phenylobacterium sp.]MBA4011138.1 energy transducer TonB [Phenylobacterium sp.]